MKKLLFSLIALPLVASAQLEFNTPGEWNEMLETASRQEKLIFIDAYTDWCGWCKVMDRETFANPDVSALMSERFVSYKVEMEKSELGLALGRKYAVNSYPTYLIFDATGKLLYKLGGYQPPQDWIFRLQKTLDAPAPERKGFSESLDMPFPEFYMNAFGTGETRKSATREEVVKFVSGKNLFNEVDFTVARKFYWLLPEETGKYVLANREKLSVLYGEDFTNDFIRGYITKDWGDYIRNAKEAELLASVDHFLEFFPGEEHVRTNMMINYHTSNKEYDRLVELVDSRLPEMDAGSINSVCWDLYEKCEDGAILTVATRWMEKALAEDPSYAHLDTQAALLYKTGAMDRAEIMAERAIQVGKENGEDVKATEELLSKIQVAKD